MAKLEIACFNNNSALVAQANGADRVELCAGMEVGGTTPFLEDVQYVRDALHIKLNVMIRPRGGNFVYSAEELEQMKTDIITFKKLGVDGFVFGILNEDNTVDTVLNKELVELASPAPCTFHRAFDDVPDYRAALEEVISCGFTTVLTSGCTSNVDKGLYTLKALVQQAGDRIVVMPGGGVRSSNIEQLLHETGASYFHSSAITDNSGIADPQEVHRLKTLLNKQGV